MNIKEWLDEEWGRSLKLAKHLGISVSAVSQWKENGVPKNRMKDVEVFTGGAVTVREMIEHRVGIMVSDLSCV